MIENFSRLGGNVQKQDKGSKTIKFVTLLNVPHLATQLPFVYNEMLVVPRPCLSAVNSW